MLEVVDPLRDEIPTVVAFGMADRKSLETAIRELEARGIRRIAVVRLFISGSSFLERTERLLGLDPPTAPARPRWRWTDASHPEIGGDRPFATRALGIPEIEGVLRDRVAALSVDPRHESVLSGLEVRIQERGLVPHPRIAEWIRRGAAEALSSRGWESPLGSCAFNRVPGRPTPSS